MNRYLSKPVILIALWILFFFSINIQTLEILTLISTFAAPLFLFNLFYTGVFLGKSEKWQSLVSGTAFYCFLAINSLLAAHSTLTTLFYVLVSRQFTSLLPAVLISLMPLVVLPFLYFSLYKTSFSISTKTKVSKKNVLLLGLGFAFLIFAAIWVQNIASYYEDKHTLNTNYAQCAWLKNIPTDWVCKDSWKGSERHLRAYDPKNPNSYLEFQIKGQKLPSDCVNFIPLSFAVSSSISSLTTPFLCLDRGGLKYQTKWNQDGWDFQLIGQNIPLSLYYLNLEAGWGQYYLPGKPLTTHPTIQISPTTFSVKNIANNQSFEISNTNLCDQQEPRLKEEMKIFLVGSNTQWETKANLRSTNPCILEFMISQSLQPGSYQVQVEVNNLRQNLKQDIEVLK